MSQVSIDALYQGFVDSLPASLRATASELPYLLKLSPEPGVGWSQVFNHHVTLAAPCLVAEAFPKAHPELVRTATLAHALAVIEAFGTDRVADRQIQSTPELVNLLEYLRAARNRALERVAPGMTREACAADARTRAAIAEECNLLARVAPVGFGEYEDVSLAKQAVGFPSSLALARTFATSPTQVDHVERMLAGVWLGLQFEDDVLDWEDDWRRGGSWVVCLAGSLRVDRETKDRPTQPDIVRRAVLSSGVLRMLLERSRRRFRAAWRHANAIGANRLGQWAKERDSRLMELIPLEARFAGYTVRMNKLAPWAIEVLT